MRRSLTITLTSRETCAPGAPRGLVWRRHATSAARMGRARMTASRARRDTPCPLSAAPISSGRQWTSYHLRSTMSTFDGFIREFDGLVRVDNFQQSGWLPTGCRASLVYLLSHAHSDHMVGLETFAGATIWCSEVTKAIVLNIRPVQARVNEANGIGNGKMDQTYRNLLPKDSSEKPLLKTMKPYDPMEIPVINSEGGICRVTLIPANHCPGSAMFLIQMWNRNVLYTGDIRAEPWWVESLTKEPQLAPFVVPPQGINHRLVKPPQDKHSPKTIPSSEEETTRPFLQLNNIYLDTSSLLTKLDVLTKEEAIKLTIEMMSAYPKDTNFFINSWTWGYEELLQRIAVHFKTSIHVDDYKYSIYKLSDFRKQFPLLLARLTLDPDETRFHACERTDRCQKVLDKSRELQQSQSLDSGIKIGSTRSKEPLVVCVNPSEITTQKWNLYKAALDVKLATAARYTSENPQTEHDLWPQLLFCPLTRHSSFKEILNFISAFRPQCIFPNTTSADTGFVEFYAIPKLFGSLLSSDAAQKIQDQAIQFVKDYEKRHSPVGKKARPSVDLFDWKGIHFQKLEEVFQKFEELEFQSAKIQSMWKQSFPTINPNEKDEAAKFLGGRPAPENSNRQDSPEIIEIQSSDEDDSSDSETVPEPSETDQETQRYRSSEIDESDPLESSEMSGSIREETPNEATRELVEINWTPEETSPTSEQVNRTLGDADCAPEEASRTPEEAKSPQHSSSDIPVTPSNSTPISRIPIASTSTNEGTSPFQDLHSSPAQPVSANSPESRPRSNGLDLSCERQTPSAWAAILQNIERQRYSEARALARHLRKYEQALDQLEDHDHSDGCHQSKKRKKAIDVGDTSDPENQSKRSSSIIIIDDSPKHIPPKDPLLVWIGVRDCIVTLTQLRAQTFHARQKGVEAIMRSS
ncbi:hypothetical protein PGTUg99_004313 [Puccinia graminis f. sp. tritici]|uniref:DNA repair metallo-beta-lactamase domain-containing protein n=1 Tax=Puccinia graminis f. sp. tritici TaxID=56615 RepID=A0A5B0MSS5_PUCGR|nr:hypothetical protein PGTUg99_004313 [Puccinia graminis f. sp. tritici]